MVRSIVIVVVAVAVGLGAFSLAGGPCAAAPDAGLLLTTSGSLDTTYGINGIAQASTQGGFGWAMALQDDGKVVVVGSTPPVENESQWTICRFNADGTVDSGFGSGGEVNLFGGSAQRATDVVLDASGRILVTGWRIIQDDGAWFTVVRLTPSGTLDPTFGTGGVADVQIGNGSASTAIALQPDGKVVVGGYAYAKRSVAFALARFNSDGSLDTQTFGDPDKKTKLFKGYTVHDIHTSERDEVYIGSIALKPDGKILLGGHRDYGSGVTDRWQIACYNTDGTVDTSFANNGVLDGGLFGYTYVNLRSIAFHNGSLYMYGRGWGTTGWIEAVVVRYGASGTLDTSWGAGGIATTGLDAEHQGKGLAFQSDGKAVIETNYYDNVTLGTTTFRFSTDGSLDQTYGSGGMGQIVPDLSAFAGVAIDSEGVIFTGGSVQIPQGETYYSLMAAAKFHGDAVVTTPPLAPTGLSATAASSSQIDLAWTDNASTEAGFQIERSPNGVDAWVQIATVGIDVTGYEDTGLEPTTAYFYRVRAYNAAGESDWSNVASDSTPAIQPPAAPTGLTANAVSSSQVNLSWTDNASDEDGFRIEKLDGSNWTTLANVGANVTSYADTGLDPETLYTYRVCAYNAGGDSGYSNIASDTTPGSVTVDHLATGDIAVTGTVSATFAATATDDAAHQEITEVVYYHRLVKQRYNYLEHRWTFNITQGSSHVFHLQAHRTASTDNDSFVFAYSTDGSNFTPMVTVTKTADDGQYQTFILPGSLSGTVWVRVTDTDRTKGIETPLDTISVDHMFIRSQ